MKFDFTEHEIELAIASVEEKIRSVLGSIEDCIEGYLYSDAQSLCDELGGHIELAKKPNDRSSDE